MKHAFDQATATSVMNASVATIGAVPQVAAAVFRHFVTGMLGGVSPKLLCKTQWNELIALAVVPYSLAMGVSVDDASNAFRCAASKWRARLGAKSLRTPKVPTAPKKPTASKTPTPQVKPTPATEGEKLTLFGTLLRELLPPSNLKAGEHMLALLNAGVPFRLEIKE